MTAVDKEAMERMHARTGHRFKEAWHDKYGPSDSPPRLLTVWNDNRCFAGEIGPRTAEALEHGIPIGSLIALSVAKLFGERGGGPRLAALIVVCEAFMRTAKPEDVDGRQQLEGIERGDLARDFANNPQTRVTQAMTTYWLSATFEGPSMWWASQPFHYDDGGGLLWDDAWVVGPEDGNSHEGHLADSFFQIFETFGVKR